MNASPRWYPVLCKQKPNTKKIHCCQRAVESRTSHLVRVKNRFFCSYEAPSNNLNPDPKRHKDTTSPATTGDFEKSKNHRTYQVLQLQWSHSVLFQHLNSPPNEKKQSGGRMGTSGKSNFRLTNVLASHTLNTNFYFIEDASDKSDRGFSTQRCHPVVCFLPMQCP